MYFPYFRGKQYELVCLRENSALIANGPITPIIEPVRSNFSGLNRAIAELVNVAAEFILIVNPKNGDLAGESVESFEKVLNEVPDDYDRLSLGFIIDERCEPDHLTEIIGGVGDRSLSFIHWGNAKPKLVHNAINGANNIDRHIFIEHACGKLYQKYFADEERVLIRDGFVRRSNREYPPVEHFSDLHITYPDEGMNGFGDFLIVGEEYSESGGPAYAVAVHMTFIDEDQDDDMHIKHFVSDRSSDPADPGGKFLEAVEKIRLEIDLIGQLFRSNACDELLDLLDRQHYPGLGYVKKLTMQHHLELMADFLP